MPQVINTCLDITSLILCDDELSSDAASIILQKKGFILHAMYACEQGAKEKIYTMLGNMVQEGIDSRNAVLKLPNLIEHIEQDL